MHNPSIQEKGRIWVVGDP